MTTTGGNAGRRTLTARPAPEFIGGALAVLVGVIVVGSTLLGGGPPPSSGGTGSQPSASPTPPSPTPEPLVNPNSVVVLRALNAQLAASGDALEREAARTNLQISNVATEIRKVNSTVLFGADIATGLTGSPSAVDIGTRLAKIYADIEATAARTLDASVNNEADYRTGAKTIVTQINLLPAIQAELDALAAAPPSASPSASASVAPSASPSAAPSSAPPPSVAPPSPPASVAPSASASGVPGSPEPSPAPGELLVNGGFEAGVGPPWSLRRSLTSQATIAADTTAPGAGTTSARVDIAVGSDAYTGITLSQPGIRVEGGRGYTISMLIRAEADRTVRVKVGSVDGGTYGLGVLPATTVWTPVSFTFFAPQSDDSAVFFIELGRSDFTTWVDLVSLRPTPALF
jgi:hypothetical protein